MFAMAKLSNSVYEEERKGGRIRGDGGGGRGIFFMLERTRVR